MEISETASRKVWLTHAQRQAICLRLLSSCKIDGRPTFGMILSLSSEYGVSTKTIGRLWKDAQSERTKKGTMVMIRKHKGNSGGSNKIVRDLSKVLDVGLKKRTTIRCLAEQLNWSKSSLHRIVKEGTIKRHSNAIKPFVGEQNAKDRVRFCLSMIVNLSCPRFIDFYNYVHIDEKWFYITKECQRYYLLPEEIEPHRLCKSKRFITKVMFLTAVARPRFDVNHPGAEFDGKIGCWPFVYKEAAKRRSKNRPVGTMETKSIAAITKPVYRVYLIEKVLPAIRAKWPPSNSDEVIYIQQDNAKPHIQVDDVEFEEAVQNCGLNAKLVCQPPNSPDLNILDLGYFRSIESLQQKQAITDIDTLIAAVQQSFNDLVSSTLNHVFLSLQQCMIEILKVNGSNKYKIPHMNKNGLERRGLLPVTLSVDREVVETATAFLE